MCALSVNLTEKETSEIAQIARQAGADVSLEEMASQLLRGHLILLRECGPVIPTPAAPPVPLPAGQTRGLGGVSLADGAGGARVSL